MRAGLSGSLMAVAALLACVSREQTYPRINPYDPGGIYYQPARVTIFPDDTTAGVGDTLLFVLAIADEFGAVDSIAWYRGGAGPVSSRMQRSRRIAFEERGETEVIAGILDEDGIVLDRDTGLVRVVAR